MESVYIVQHVNIINEDEEDIKLIGVYTTEELALQAIERTKKLEGFSECPEGFHVDKYELNKDHWTEGYITVYS